MGKFKPEIGKKYLKKHRLYPAFLYYRLDKWLKSMSLNGWHIVHTGFFTFWFEEGEPKQKEYFTCIPATREGKYSLGLRHPLFERKYGVKEKRSKINSNEAKKHNILEIDQNRIDIDNDIGYKELISDRNRLNLQLFIRDMTIFAVTTLVLTAILLI